MKHLRKKAVIYIRTQRKTVWEDKKMKFYSFDRYKKCEVCFNGMDESVYGVYSIVEKEDCDLFYFSYSKEYGFYHYDNGVRDVVDVPSPKEQFDHFLEQHPKAKFCFVSAFDGRMEFQKWEESEIYRNSARIIGDVLEVVLLAAYNRKTGVFKCINSERFSTTIRNNNSFYEWNSDYEARTPVLAYAVKKEKEKIRKEKYERDVKQCEIEVYEIQKQFYFEKKEFLIDRIKSSINGTMYSY